MNMHRHLAGRAAGFTKPAASLFRAAAAGVRRLLAAAVGLLWMTGPVVPAGGALTGYRHEAATNRLAFSLNGVLPLASDAPPAVREFAVHMNPDEPVAQGEAVSEPMEGGRRLTWRMDSPRGTADYAFESLIEPNDSGHALTIRTLRR